jgi:zinc protease
MSTHLFVGKARSPRARGSLRRLWRTWILLALGALILHGCAAVPSRPFAPSSDVLRETLGNGLQVVIVRDALAPVVTQELTFFAGGNQSPPGFPGMAHAQEHMMFRGSPGLSGDQLSDITAELGGDSNAFTTSTTTSYYFTVPADDLDLTLQVDALRMAGVDDEQALWEKERGAIEQEVARDLSNPSYVLEAQARERIFAGTAYADTGLGTKESFDRTTAQMLKSFRDAWYAPNNALLVLAGDVDPQAVLAKVRERFGPIPRRPVPQRAELSFQEVSPESFTSTTDQPYGFVAYTFRTPGYRSADAPAVQILAQVLNSPRGAISSLAFQGKALDAGFDQQTFTDIGYATAWAAFPQGADAAALANELRSAVEQASGAISSDLVDAERRRIVLENELRGDSVARLARSWTDAVAVKGLSSPEEEAAMLQKVDARAVSDAARRFIDFSHALSLELTPSAAQHPPGGEAFGAPESFASTPEKPVELPPWAASALEKLPHPLPLFAPSVFDLPSGLRLIVQPLPSTRAVSLYGDVHTNEGLQAPVGKEGVSDMLDTLFSWGPRSTSREQFEAAMDSIGANYQVGTSFSLQTLGENFAAGVKLLSDALRDPALPQEAFDSQKPIQVRQAAGNVGSPVFQFRLAVQKGLAPQDDPSLRRPTPQSVGSLTLEDVRRYYQSVMRPDETTIVVMGGIDAATAKAVIEKSFGDWTAAGPRPVLDYAPIPPSAPQTVFISDPVRQQNQVVLAETLPLTYNDPVHYALRLGNEFLGGDSFASPLYRELRVTRGLVYNVGSSTSFSRTRGDFSLSFGAAPENVDQAKQLAVQILKNMAANPMTDQELHLAKAQSLRQIELTNQTAGDIANSWLGYSEEGLALDRLFEVARQDEGLTASAIQEAFKKYLDTDRLSTFVLGVAAGH